MQAGSLAGVSFMRVLYLSAEAGLGGAERSLLDILASMRAAQPSWTLNLVTAADGPLVQQAAALGVLTLVVPFDESLARLGETGSASRAGGQLTLAARAIRAAVPATTYVLKLRRLTTSIAPDIIHTNNLKMHVIGAWVRPSNAALVWHLHDFIGSRPLSRRALRATCGRASAVVANSESVAEDARAVLDSRVPVVMVHNGVDLERFSGTGDHIDLDRRSGLPPARGVARVGLVATFGRWKGHTTFIDAIAQLPGDLPVRGYIIGGAVYRTDNSQYSIDDLKRYAAERGVADRVGFTGFIEQPEAALRSLDVVVHASTSPEPFGLVIAEAMACGRAVIASNAGGAREIFTPGVDALVHAPGNAADLAARIVELVRDPQARQRIGQAGRKTAERRFDRARLATDLVPVYRKVVHA
jgi:glycosyltransferase involved in cell wall biosynthesis